MCNSSHRRKCGKLLSMKVGMSCSNMRKFLSVRCLTRLMSMLYVISFCAQQPKLNTLYDHRFRKCRLYTTAHHVVPSFQPSLYPIFAIGKFLPSSLRSLLQFLSYIVFQKEKAEAPVMFASCALKVEVKSLLSHQN